MKDPGLYAEVRGRVKYKGVGSYIGDYKTGKMVVAPEGVHWKCQLWINTKRESPVVNLQINDKIKSLINRPDRVILDLATGYNIYVIADQGDLAHLKKVQELLCNIKQGKTVHVSENKAEVGGHKNHVLTASNVSPKTNSPDVSPVFTSVKENRGSNGDSNSLGHRLFEDDDVDSKENYHSGPRWPAEKFLKQGQDKSRETLKSFAASGFYSSTPASHTQKMYSRTCESSGSAKRPGMMPLNPTPQKRPRLLSDLNYSWGKKVSQDSSNQQQSLLGFSNIGNTCYMNAILQSLFGLNPFSNDLLYSFKKKGRSFSPNSLYCSLARLVKIQRRPGSSDFNKRELLRNVKSAISGTAKRFSGYQQHDAHEFLSQVLDQLKEEIVKFNKSTPSPTRDPSEDIDLVNPTLDNFEFEVLHTITCLKCDEEVAKSEQFNDLSLEMPQRSHQGYPKSLQDALDVFLQQEEIDYTCAKCGHTKSKVKHKFTRIPRILILHLKRYAYSASISLHSKMGQRIFIPSYVSLSSHVDSDVQCPPPIPCVLPQSSPMKSLPDLDDRKGDHSRRKLDYTSDSKYTFKSLHNKQGEDSTDQPAPHTERRNSTDLEDSKLFPSFALDESTEDADMARAIELSLQEAKMQEQQQEAYKDSPSEDEDNSMKDDVMEISELPQAGQQVDISVSLTETDLRQMTEEQRIEVAIQQSLMESQGPSTSLSSLLRHCLSRSLIVKECSGAFLASQAEEPETASPEFPLIKQRGQSNKERETKLVNGDSMIRDRTECEMRAEVDGETGQGQTCVSGVETGVGRTTVGSCPFDEVDGAVLEQMFSENSEDVFGSELSVITPTVRTTKGSDGQCGGLTQGEIEHIFGDESVASSEAHNDQDKEKTERKKTVVNDEVVDLTCWEEKENLKPEVEANCVAAKQDDIYPDEPSQEEILLIKQKRSQNENGMLPCSYRLVSIVNHIGHSSSAGHYISDVYNMKRKSWLSFDDAHVSKLPETEIRTRRERSGYIFFYMCKEVFEELESLHTASILNKEN
ncbi:LOW QUALITY PROTEIN: ubiquitin carboxyl-terminal hydrolase 37-like [Haliotis rubra]|uniref:LOW QUALITY PROTEIN: ubiquitin carboxyl-terminal hydrolase 37-like n=1 Tax=Haliotis rubra TaxID=36100 RepID=UPI001EE52B2B|nr:LOW QUALITY PROTEIN: ubiquitin carboxyl-terminal hydrolase 37-like [Haliotis rubra]